jgi:hypothetical protein
MWYRMFTANRCSCSFDKRGSVAYSREKNQGDRENNRDIAVLAQYWGDKK